MAKHWIQSAIKKPGALHEQLHVPKGEKIPVSKLNAAAKKGGKIGQRARLAKTLGNMHHGESHRKHLEKKVHAGLKAVFGE